MPNAFTPNGDGKNDVFHFVSRGNQVLKTFQITNRWGQVVFETVNPSVGWDGKLNGVVQDMGTYFYYIKYVCANGRTYQQKGEVLLIK
jgi:gliding motility-associated-like protein